MKDALPQPASLRVAMDANAEAYRRVVRTSAPGDCWDLLILTAANEKQAEGYRQELALRHRGLGPASSFFPDLQRSIVVADPPGRRAGSGGATLGALREACRQLALGPADFAHLRILMIHSGGASQRLPAYSALGKIFAPLPLLRPDGQISTLFDHLYVTLAGLPERLGAGMLIVAGDVFLIADHRHISAPSGGVTALTMRVDAGLARDHGVFVTDTGLSIERTLQKASPEVLQEAGAVDSAGRVLIDTGLLFFDVPAVSRLAALAGVGTRRRGLDLRCRSPIDLYDDMSAALAGSTTRKGYLSHGDDSCRREIFHALHGTAFRAMLLHGEFLHLGTTRQFRDAMVGLNPSPAADLFQSDLLLEGAWPGEGARRVFHSVTVGDGGQPVSMGEGSLVEHSILAAGSRIGRGSVVSQTLAARRPLILGDNLLLFQVPIRHKGAPCYAQVLCGIEDDFKGHHADGRCTFLNQPVDQWLKRHRIDPREIWPGVAPARRTLWNARLFVATDDRDHADAVLWFGRSTKGTTRDIQIWRRSRRCSMEMLLEEVDPEALIGHREVVAATLQTTALLSAIRSGEDRPLDSYLSHFSSPAAPRACIERLETFAAGPAPAPTDLLERARGLWCAAQLAQRPDNPAVELRLGAEGCMSRAFACIARASEPGTIAVRSRRPGSIVPGRRFDAAAPVRLDLSGGWSDTPPYCYERGGHVVNLAIDLDRQAPVRAVVRTIREPMLILETHDLGRHTEIRRRSELDAASGVHDPFALHKVAIGLVGLAPPPRTELAAHLRRLGGGLIVSTECRVPKGSGLGTSSILAATLLAALRSAVGESIDHGQLISQTLLLEQRLSTGGGWQDQVGGIVGGVKSTTTAPGVPQVPDIERLALSDEVLDGLEQRLVVYYSGQQRLARDILRRVMGRWLAREPAVVGLLSELKQSAAALRTALLKGRWPAVAREIARYWEIKKQLYPGSTTPTIDVMLLELKDLYIAAGLAGAGGGGFGYFLCRDARQAQRLRRRLEEISSRPGSLGAVYDACIDRQGLRIATNRL